MEEAPISKTFSLDNGREKRFLVRSEMCAIPSPTS